MCCNTCPDLHFDENCVLIVCRCRRGTDKCTICGTHATMRRWEFPLAPIKPESRRLTAAWLRCDSSSLRHLVARSREFDFDLVASGISRWHGTSWQTTFGSVEGSNNRSNYSVGPFQSIRQYQGPWPTIRVYAEVEDLLSPLNQSQ